MTVATQPPKSPGLLPYASASLSSLPRSSISLAEAKQDSKQALTRRLSQRVPIELALPRLCSRPGSMPDLLSHSYLILPTTVQWTRPHPHFMAEETEAQSHEGVCTDCEELGSNPGLHRKLPLLPTCWGIFQGCQ